MAPGRSKRLSLDRVRGAWCGWFDDDAVVMVPPAWAVSTMERCSKPNYPPEYAKSAKIVGTERPAL